MPRRNERLAANGVPRRGTIDPQQATLIAWDVEIAQPFQWTVRRDLANVLIAAAVALDVAESLVHGVAVRAPERLADDEFAAEVTDVLVRYLAR
jgi:hypothetical protein